MYQISISLPDILVQPSSLAHYKMPPVRRVPACTHFTMTRLYGSYRCSHCFRTSRLGWLYSCTQDKAGETAEGRNRLDALMAAVTVHQHERSDISQSIEDDMDDPPVRLSAWLETAIVDGKYTPEQIRILRAQKRKVQGAIAVVQRGYLLAQQVNVMPSSITSQRTLTGIEGPGSLVPTVPVTTDDPGTKNPTPFEPIDTRVVSSAPPNVIPDCNYMTCQVCRPISRDRAWQCFDHAFDTDPHYTYPDFASDPRPISDASLVRRLGLWKSRPRPRTFESVNSIILTDDDQSQTDSNRQDSHSRRESRDSASRGFRVSVQRVIQELMTVSRQSSTRSRVSKDSSPSTLNTTAENDKRDETHRRWSEENNNRVFGDSKTRLSRYGRQRRLWRKDGKVISDSPAPRNALFNAQDDRVETRVENELRVENGIAVTEEGINLGSADIIIQV